MNAIVLISDFKFLMAHFYPFLGYVERYRPEMMFMPTNPVPVQAALKQYRITQRVYNSRKPQSIYEITGHD